MKIESSVEKAYTFTFSFNHKEFDIVSGELDAILGNGELRHAFWAEFYNAMAEYYD